MNISVCIPAYNEEKDIAALIEALTKQKTSTVHIREIVVVASGCTDKTVEIVQKLQQKIASLKLIIQEKRQGKAAAINAFLQQASQNICVVCSADVLPLPETIEQLCLPFQLKSVGMTGGHPIPLNKPNRFIGYAVRTLWQLHHEIATRNPKCGEIIAFRKIFDEIPAESPVDEASIEAIIHEQGLSLKYAPEAIVHNKGPTTVHDFIQQRRRINYGHIWLNKKSDYQVSTNKATKVLPLIFKKIELNPKHFIWFMGLIAIELTSRVLAWIDYRSGKKTYTMWEPVKSSKNLKDV